MLRAHRVARVAADPARVPLAAVPGGWDGLVYFRLHGSPRMYYSDYAPAQLVTVARQLQSAAAAAEGWCIFDNTTLGAATGNAMALARLVSDVPASARSA
jgi:uncharacterized protein YecE (DUF72 family)